MSLTDACLPPSLEGHTGGIASVVFSPQDSSRILTASSDGSAKLWNASAPGLSLFQLRAGKSATNVFRAGVNSVVFNRDGTRLLTANGEDNVVRLWDGLSGQLLSSLGNPTEISLAGTGSQRRSVPDSLVVGPVAAFGPDSARAVLLSGGTLRLWAAAERKLLISWPAQKDRVASAVFSPDGNRVASIGLDNTIKIWNVINGGLLASLEGHPDAIQQPLGVPFMSSPSGGWHYAAFNPEGSRIVTAGRDGTTTLWDIATGEIVVSLRTGVPRLVAFSPDGTRILIVRNRSATAELWSTTTSLLLFSLEGHTSYVDFAAFHPDPLCQHE